MPRNLLQILTESWAIKDTSPSADTIDMIVPISYSTRANRLTYGSYEAAFRSAMFTKRHQQAIVCFGNTTYLHSDADKIEGALKTELLYKNGVPMEFIHNVGPITNSIDEAEAIRRHCASHRIKPRNILLVAGMTHARSVLYIWKKIFPEANIYIYTMDYRFETEAYHPQKFLQSQWKFLAANVARHCALRTCGLNIVKKIRQPLARS